MRGIRFSECGTLEAPTIIGEANLQTVTIVPSPARAVSSYMLIENTETTTENAVPQDNTTS